MRFVASCLVALLIAVTTATAQDIPLTSRLEARLRERPAEEAHHVWVFLRDKGPRPEAAALEAIRRLTPRALSRRALRGGPGALVRAEDLPVLPAYLDAVTRAVTRVRHVSRWFNAVSAEATAAQVRELAALPFVERLDIVRRYRGRPEPAAAGSESRPRGGRSCTARASARWPACS